MRHFATSGLSLALLALAAASAPQAQEIRTHDTGPVQFEAFDNGFLGESASDGPTPGAGGFFFDGEFGLYEGQLIVATPTQVCGEAYAGQTGQEPLNWVNTAPFETITTFDEPYEEFDEGYAVEFDCSGDAAPLDIIVNESSFSRTGDPYVVFEFDVSNQSATAIDSVYIGIFADLDVGDFAQNLAGYDEATGLLYVWDPSGANPNYYGMALVDGPASGYTFDAGFGVNPTAADLLLGLTNGGEPAPTTPDDRRTVLGAGPFVLKPGGSAAPRFVFVAGADEAEIIANAAAALEAVEIEEPGGNRTHDTGLVQFEAFDNGFLGESANFGDTPGAGGFFFDGEFGLFEGQLLVATATTVCGEAYAGAAPQEDANWVNTDPFTTLTPPYAEPYEEFDEGYAVEFDCSGDANPLPIIVNESSFSRTGDPYVVFEFDVTNTSATAIDDAYVGIFADLDVGDFTANLAGYDEATRLLYVWDDTGANPNYYGVALVDGPASGYAFDAGAGTNPTAADLLLGLTNGGEPVPVTPDDRRTVLGAGPFDLAAGGSAAPRFVFVAGTSEAEIIASAAAAIEAVGDGTAIDPGPDGQPGTHALSAPAPNPASGEARFTLELAAAQVVRVAAYDVLGREVALLHEGTLSSGIAHAFALDTRLLPAGVYLVRASGEGFSETRQLTVTR